jgi:hypothetical protein
MAREPSSTIRTGASAWTGSPGLSAKGGPDSGDEAYEEPGTGGHHTASCSLGTEGPICGGSASRAAAPCHPVKTAFSGRRRGRNRTSASGARGCRGRLRRGNPGRWSRLRWRSSCRNWSRGACRPRRGRRKERPGVRRADRLQGTVRGAAIEKEQEPGGPEGEAVRVASPPSGGTPPVAERRPSQIPEPPGPSGRARQPDLECLQEISVVCSTLIIRA